MNRRTVTQELGAGRQRARAIVTSDPCESSGPESQRIKTALLMDIATTPELTACGFEPFQKLRMFHDGSAWVVEVEATMDVPFGAGPVREEQ